MEQATAPLAALLTKLGVVSSKEHDTVTSRIEKELAEREHAAHIFSLRYGVLTLEAADPIAATKLRYDTDNLLAAIADETDVTTIRVRTK